MPITATRPEYNPDEIDNPNDYKPGAAGNSFSASDLKSIAVLLYAASVRESTQDNAKPGDKFVVVYGRFLEDVHRLPTKSGEILPHVSVGEPFSCLTGAKMIVPVVVKLLRDGKLRDIDDDTFKARGVVGRIIAGKATKGNPPLSFIIADPDEQLDLRAKLEAADGDDTAGE